MANCSHHRRLRPHCSHLCRLRPPLLLLCLALVAVAADGPAAPTAGRPGCPTRCGAVDIPYPFGIGQRCAINSDFAVDCNTTVDDGGTISTAPFIYNLPLTKISVADSKIWVKQWISMRCYNIATGKVSPYEYVSVDLTDTPFWFSDVDNKFFVIGCNWSAYMTDGYRNIGCYTMCDDMIVTDGECSGVGCCYVDVPKNLHYIQTNFDEHINNTDPNRPCGYNVMMESAAFNFNTTYLTSTVLNDTYKGMAPMVLSWHIGYQSCVDAKKNMSSYTCVSKNSECANSTYLPGYLCKCSNGYMGNPYIKGVDGCTDIDECLNTTHYPCSGKCKNTVGSFICSCPPGKQMVQGHCVKSSWVIAVGFYTVIGIVVGALLVLIVFFVYKRIKHRKVQMMKRKFFEQNRGRLLQQLVSQRADIAERMIIPLEELEKATNSFDKARELGGGGHGVVYKGILSDLHVVAIKKPKKVGVVEKEIDEFINEVAILSQINHRNVVKLYGCCLETEVPMLVYEFISNGTLYDHLHVQGPTSLSWNDRLRIAAETAGCLAYLHSTASVPIVHRDVKSGNILLDDSFTSKVADFGASRYVPVERSGLTTMVQGTRGYLDPMYFYTGRLTDKSDVYSFGVMLVELLTRKKPFSYLSAEGEGLVVDFATLFAEGNLSQILDPQVMEEGGEKVETVAALAVECIKLRGEDRPTMKQVETALGSLQPHMQRVQDRMAVDTTETGVAISYPSPADGSHQSMRSYSREEELMLSSKHPW